MPRYSVAPDSLSRSFSQPPHVACVPSVFRVPPRGADKALTNVEHLEEMETKAEQFQEHAKQFSKNSAKLKDLFRCRYYKINLLLAILVTAIVAYSQHPHTH